MAPKSKNLKSKKVEKKVKDSKKKVIKKATKKVEPKSKSKIVPKEVKKSLPKKTISKKELEAKKNIKEKKKTPSKGEDKTLYKIENFDKFPECKKKRTVGIIVDSSRPYKTTNCYGYVTKLKVIDESFNFDKQSAKHAKKYLSVYCFANRLEDTISVNNIGDIIYLKRFNFSESPLDKNELKAKSCNLYSKVYVFDGIANNLHVTSPVSNQDYIPNDGLKKRISELREFSKKYLSKMSVTDMAFYGLSEVDQNDFIRQDFDLILKVKAVENIKDSKMQSYTLEDGEKKVYFFHYNLTPFKVGDMVKLRSMCRLTPTRLLQGNTFSSMLRIPPFAYDCQSNNFKNLIYDIVFLNNKKITTETEDTPLKTEDFDNEDSQTILKKKWTSSLPLTKLNEIGESKGKNKSLSSEVLKVRCCIKKVTPKKLDQALKKFCTVQKKNFDFTIKEDKMKNKELRKIWQMCFQVQDDSLKKGQVKELYLYTTDDNGKDIFPGFNPYNITLNDQTQKSFDQFLSSITNNKMNDMCVEPMVGADNVVKYRIVDTRFK